MLGSPNTVIGSVLITSAPAQPRRLAAAHRDRKMACAAVSSGPPEVSRSCWRTTSQAVGVTVTATVATTSGCNSMVTLCAPVVLM